MRFLNAETNPFWKSNLTSGLLHNISFLKAGCLSIQKLHNPVLGQPTGGLYENICLTVVHGGLVSKKIDNLEISTRPPLR